MNDFRKTLADMESGMDARDVEKKARLSHRANAIAEDGEGKGTVEEGVVGEGKKEDEEMRRIKDGDVGVINLGLVKTDPNKLYPLIYYAIKVSQRSLCCGNVLMRCRTC